MSKIIKLGDYRHKETVALLRELLVKATRGAVTALAVNVEFKDGTQKTGFTGRYQADPSEALRVANRMSQRLNAVQDLRDAAAMRRNDEPSAVCHLSGRPG